MYGNQDRYPTVETDLPKPFSPYGVTKLAAEHLCGLYAENWGVHTVSLRYFTVFGPRQRPDMSIHRLCQAAVDGSAFPRYGDGTQIREFTYVSDIVAGNLAAADRDVAPGTYLNLAGGAEITLNDLIALVGDVAGSPVAVEQDESEAGRLVPQRWGDRPGARAARRGRRRCRCATASPPRSPGTARASVQSEQLAPQHRDRVADAAARGRRRGARASRRPGPTPGAACSSVLPRRSHQ